MNKKTVINILMVLCLLIAIGSGGYLAYYYYTSHKQENDFISLREMIVDEPVISQDETSDATNDNFVDVNGIMVQKKFERLYRENPHFMGWIQVKDTNIDYPVMYTPSDMDNGEYYIHRDFNQNYSSAGVPFLDCYCSVNPPTDNIIIYGHNMNSGKMFHDLLKYEDKDFYDNHKTFIFDTIYGDGTYEVVAVIRSQILPEDSTEFKYYEFVNAGSKELFDNYVENIKKISIIDTGVDVKYGDHLVTLSTCAYHVKNGRFAVIGKKIEE
ncbi:MAG: class B sortase [Lachnospiraceae bacterium]